MGINDPDDLESGYKKSFFKPFTDQELDLKGMIPF